MDFHCLARKELQFLCKRNKIPANITNVAMVEDLKSLELVEGLEELQLQNQSQSPEKSMNKEIPSTGTVTRTSTRRKPRTDEQSTRSTIRTQKTTRKTMEVEEENKNLNVPEIEVEDQRKSGMVETPLPSGRRRPGVGSTRSKVEAQKESSLQPAYGTRRSVRLLEKCMNGLSIKETEKKPVKVDEMLECEVGNNNSQSGTTSELPLARNLSASLDDESELKDGVEENSKCDDGEGNEKTDEHELDDEDKFADDVDGIIDLNGSDVAYKNLHEKSAVSQDGNLNKEPVVDETKSIEVLVPIVEDVPEEFADYSSSADMEATHVDETISIEELVANVEDVPEEVADHSSSADTEAIHDDLTIHPEHVDRPVLLAEGPMDSSVKTGNEESNDDAFLGDSDIDDDTESDSRSLADQLQEEVSGEQKSRCIPTAAYNSKSPRTMVLVDEDDADDMDDTEIEDSDGNSDIDYDTGSDSESLSEDPTTMDEEALVDANVTESKTTPVSSFHKASQSVVDNIQVEQMENYVGDPEALIHVCVKPAEEFAEIAVKAMSPVSNSETITTSMPPSPLKAQFSSQPTIAKVTQVSDNLNKENIVEKELEPCLRKVKKNVIDEETMKKLEGFSLRKLNKMFKNLKINEKQSWGKSRPALQMLSQNSMKSEGEKQN